MYLLDLTLPTPAENVALDEALLEQAIAERDGGEVLRLWEPSQLAVVIGRGSRAVEEVNLPACREHHVPVLRRTSGGAGIVSGPGCLMYAVILSYERRPELHSLDAAHRFVLETMIRALETFTSAVKRRGTSDLVIEEPGSASRKFSGNSLRAKSSHFLYHGTLLYDFRLDAIGRYLTEPPRQPEYRAGRNHLDFVMNLPASGPGLRVALRDAWQAQTALDQWPEERVADLVREKYLRDEWNFRH